MNRLKQIIQETIDKTITNILTERMIKTLKLLPNAQTINMEKQSSHYKNDRQMRNDVIQNLGGYGNPIATFLVFDYKDYKNKLHTITDKGICIVQSAKTKKIITAFPINYKTIEKYYQQLNNNNATKKEVPTTINKDTINDHNRQYKKIAKQQHIKQ